MRLGFPGWCRRFGLLLASVSARDQELYPAAVDCLQPDHS